MPNFSYLSTRPEYSLFANSAIEAEKVFSTSPAMCAVGCRKALELAVKWVYAADKTITMPYKDNLQSLLHEPSFRFAVDRNVWSVLPSIVKAGNLAVHTGHSVSAADAVFSLRGLFDFIQWVDYCYGTDYVERSFDETAIPGEKVALDEKKIREQESLLTQKDAELEALRKQVESLSAAYTASKQQNQQSRSFTAVDLTEAETRRKIIDIDLKAMGWKFTGPDADVRTEYEVDNMNGVHGQQTAEPAEPQFHRRRPDRGRNTAEDHRHRPQGHGLEIHRAGRRCAHRVRSGQHERRAGAEGLCGLCADGQGRLAAGGH